MKKEQDIEVSPLFICLLLVLSEHLLLNSTYFNLEGNVQVQVDSNFCCYCLYLEMKYMLKKSLFNPMCPYIPVTAPVSHHCVPSSEGFLSRFEF